jgi:hypothetical protein
MSPAFLVFANLWLLARLVCLFRDEASPGRLWLGKTTVELTALLVLYADGWARWGAAVTVIILNFLGYRLECRRQRKYFTRLLLGVAGLAAWSVWFSQSMGLGFRQELAIWAAQLESRTAFAALFRGLGDGRLQLMLFGLLLSANEANLAIRAVFDQLDLKPRSPRSDALAVDEGEFNRGRVIGMLERVLLYGFVLQAQYGAIGFVLAAKAFTRSKALDDRPFAEYVLIGTLLSACLALLIGGGVKWLLLRA